LSTEILIFLTGAKWPRDNFELLKNRMEVLVSDSHPAATAKELFSNFVQIGVVVADVDKATHYLTEIFGIGPWRIIDWPPAGRTDIQKFYYGELGDFTARMAFAELGTVELELIQPKEGKSIWADFLRDHGGGIHHLRFNVDDIEPVQAHLAQYGIVSAQHGSGIRPGTLWMNFASEDKIGFVMEIMKVMPGTTGRTPAIVDGNVVG
jgi:methylmalonyl-CoA/ethylmalonyl-CoA epimerase